METDYALEVRIDELVHPPNENIEYATRMILFFHQKLAASTKRRNVTQNCAIVSKRQFRYRSVFNVAISTVIHLAN